MNLKDSVKEDEAKTDQSEFFKSILIKYYEDRLTFADIISLKKFIDTYNEAAEHIVEELFNDELSYEDFAKDILKIQKVDGQILDISDTEISFYKNFKDAEKVVNNLDNLENVPEVDYFKVENEVSTNSIADDEVTKQILFINKYLR
jgi:hypothetical protein